MFTRTCSTKLTQSAPTPFRASPAASLLNGVPFHCLTSFIRLAARGAVRKYGIRSAGAGTGGVVGGVGSTGVGGGSGSTSLGIGGSGGISTSFFRSIMNRSAANISRRAFFNWPGGSSFSGLSGFTFSRLPAPASPAVLFGDFDSGCKGTPDNLRPLRILCSMSRFSCRRPPARWQYCQ